MTQKKDQLLFMALLFNSFFTQENHNKVILDRPDCFLSYYSSPNQHTLKQFTTFVSAHFSYAMDILSK